MQKVKFCPMCEKESDVSTKVCECGYNFIFKETNDETKSDNTKTKVDNTPLGLWTFIGFICFIVGIVLHFRWKEEWPVRAKCLLRGVIDFAIFVGVVVIVIVAYFILDANGLIV